VASEPASPEDIANERARVREIAGGPVARPHRWYRRPLQVIGVVVAVMVAIAGIEQMAYANRVLPGVDVAGAGVAQKTKSAARDAIADRAAHIESDPIVATFAGRNLTTTPAAIGLHVDADATYADAKDAGRKDQNPAELLVGPFTRLVAGDDVAWHVTFDAAKVRAVLANWERTNVTGHVPGDVTFEGTTVVPHLPVVGKTVDANAAYAPFVAALRAGVRGPVALPTKPVRPVLTAAEVQRVAEQARVVLSQPYDIVADTTHMQIAPAELATGLVTTRKPDGTGLALTINAAKLAATMGTKAKGFEVAPVDARFVVNGNNTVSVVPSKDGLQLDYKALAGPIVAGQRTIRASLGPLHPARDTKWAQGLGIKEMVSTFTTMHPCCAPRVTNIHHGADLIQNTVVEPGQRFSLNAAMGQRTLARGFVVAPIYDHGHKDDVGGGVS
jgi:hypothetical protein